MTGQRPHLGTFAAVVIVGTLWGLNWPAVKYLLTEIGPLSIRAYAFPCAAIVLAMITKARGENLAVPRGAWPALIQTALFLIFGFNVLVSIGQMLMETSKAAIIAYTMPALTAALAALTLREQITWRILTGLAFGMAGLVLLGSENVGAVIAAPVGPVVMLAAAVSWAIGNVMLKANTLPLTPLALTAWFFALSAITTWPLVFIFEPPWSQQMPSAGVFATFAFHVAGPMVTSYVLWTVLVSRLTATIAAISTLLAPVVGVLSAIMLLGDPVTWQKVAALAMILASIVVTLRGHTSAVRTRAMTEAG